MEPDLSRIFHASSKDHAKGHIPISKDSTQWPAEWRTVQYKEYPRLPSTALPQELPIAEHADLYEVIRKRQSKRDFQVEPISVKDVSRLLKYSCGIQNIETKHRTYPSAGARFPIEVYPLILTPGGEIAEGVYHYNVRAHALETLWKRSFSSEQIDTLFTYDWVRNASLAVILTVTFSRTEQKYGERGYRYMALEAGHIGQNFYLVASSLGLKCCSLGGTRDENLESLLDIDGTTESVVYAIVFGK